MSTVVCVAYFNIYILLQLNDMYIMYFKSIFWKLRSIAKQNYWKFSPLGDDHTLYLQDKDFANFVKVCERCWQKQNDVIRALQLTFSLIFFIIFESFIHREK